MDRQERRGPLGRGWILHRAGLALIDTGQVVQGAGSDPMVACGGFSHNTTGRCTEAQCGFIHWKRGSGGGIAVDLGLPPDCLQQAPLKLGQLRVWGCPLSSPLQHHMKVAEDLWVGIPVCE